MSYASWRLSIDRDRLDAYEGAAMQQVNSCIEGASDYMLWFWTGARCAFAMLCLPELPDDKASTTKLLHILAELEQERDNGRSQEDVY